MKSSEIFLLLNIRTMAYSFSPSKGSYVLNQFPSIVMFSMKGSASGAIQGHHGPLVHWRHFWSAQKGNSISWGYWINETIKQGKLAEDTEKL